MADGRPLARVKELATSGYTFDDATHVLRIHHQQSHNISIQGKFGPLVPTLVTFDDPHQTAGTLMRGGYPDSRIDWGSGVWKIAPPGGKFATFHLTLADAASNSASFRFAEKRIFAGIDISNDGPNDATIAIRSPEQQEQTVALHSGELKRVRTGWTTASTTVEFASQTAGALRFDNLALAVP
jgi:hypothetical protein